MICQHLQQFHSEKWRYLVHKVYCIKIPAGNCCKTLSERLMIDFAQKVHMILMNCVELFHKPKRHLCTAGEIIANSCCTGSFGIDNGWGCRWDWRVVLYGDSRFLSEWQTVKRVNVNAAAAAAADWLNRWRVGCRDDGWSISLSLQLYPHLLTLPPRHPLSRPSPAPGSADHAQPAHI